MKPLLGDTITNDSCSCTSKSASNCQTLRRLLQQGSRINKLINGKYQMQFKDGKLMDELFKTRALYEALRSQFLSSTLSLSSKTELKISQSTPKEKDLKMAVYNDDILALVNLVDKGAVVESRKLIECCSCCTCCSKTKLEHAQKVRRNRQSHTGGHIISKSSLASKQDSSDAKNIKSDSFTCACKNHGQINLDSREIFNKIHLEQPITKPGLLTKFKSINNGKMKKSYHKLKRSKAIPNTYTENIGEGKKKKIRKSKQSGDDTKKLDQLDVEQKTIKDSFVAEKKAIKDSFVAEKKAIKDSFVAEKKAIKDSFDAEKKAIKDSFVTEKKAIKDNFVAEKKAAQKHKPEKKTMAPITAIGSRDNKNPMKDSKGSRERNISPVTQNPEHRIKKIRNQNSEDSSSASATSIRKDKKKPFNKIEPEFQNPEHRMKKIRNQNSKDSSGTSATSIRKDNKKPFNKTEPETQNTEHRMKKIRNQNSKDSSGTSATSIRKDNKKPFNKTEPETQNTEHSMKKIRNQNSKDSPDTSATSIRKDKKKLFNKTEPETQNTEHRMKKIRNQISKDSPGTSVTSIRKDKKKTFNKTELETQNTEHRMKKIRNQNSKESFSASATSIRKDKKKPFNKTEPVTPNTEHRMKKIRNQHSKDSSGTSATSIRKDKKKPFNETEPVTQNPEHRIKKIRNQKSKDSSSTSATSLRKDKRKPFNKTEPVTQNPEHRIKKIRNQNSKDSSGASATSIRKDKKKPFNKTEPETQNTEHRLKKIRNQNSKDSFSASATSIRKDKKKLFNKTEPVTQNTEHRMKKIRNQNSKDSFGTSATSIGKDKKKPFNKTEPETQNTEHRLKKIRNQNSKESFSASATSIRKDKKKPFNKTEPVTQNTEHRMKKIRNQNSKDSSGTSATSIRIDKKKLFNKTEPATQNPEHRIKKIRKQKSKDSSSTSATSIRKDKKKLFNKTERETQNTEYRIKKIRNQNSKDSSGTSATSIRKDKKKPFNKTEPTSTINEQLKNQSQKRNKSNVLNELVGDMKKKLKGHRAIQETNQTKKPRNGVLASALPQKKRSFRSATSLPSISSVSGKPGKQLAFSIDQGKETKTNATRSPRKIPKSISTSSIEKSYSAVSKKFHPRRILSKKISVKSFSSNENKTKAGSPISFHRQLRLPSPPERFIKSGVRKGSPKTQQPDRNNWTSHQERTSSRELFRENEKTLVKSFSSKENKTKAESPVPFRRQLRFPSAPERFVKSAVPKDSPKAQQPDRNNRTSHQERTYSRELFRQHEKTLQHQKFRQREGSHQRKGSQRDESYNPDKSLKRDDPSYSMSPKRQEQVKSTTKLEKSRPRRKSQQREIICECEKFMRHKQSPQRKNKQIIKNIQAGGHALKRCLCTLKIKVKKTKSKINKNYIQEIPQMKISLSAHSKVSISSVKSSLKPPHSTIPKSESASICECSDYDSKIKGQEMLNKELPENIKKSQHNLLTQRPALPAQTGSDSHKMKTPTLSISKFSNINKKTSKGKGRTAFILPQQSKHTHSNRSVHDESRGGSPDKHIITGSRPKPKFTLKNSSIKGKEKLRLKNQSVQTTTDTPSNKQRIKLLPNRTSLASFVSHASKGMKILSFEHRPKNQHFSSKNKISIEFLGNDNSKTGRTNNQSTPKTMHKNKLRSKRIRNKGSQISNSTPKSRRNKRKHGLHMCLCKLKKENNTENLSKKNIIQPENTVESPQSEMQSNTVSMSAERQMYHNVMKHVILPYECETPFCGPQYNSTKSYKIMHTTANREERKIIKHVKADYRKSQSDYSLTSQSLEFTNNIVSSIVSHKSEILKPILKKDKPNSPDITRQEVMSNFHRSSMNSKRHSYSPADKDSKIKKDSYQRSSKDIELKDYKSSKSLLGNDKKQDRSLLLGSTVKRCLCALKIYKNGKTNEQSIAVNTDTIPNSIPDKKYPVTQSKLSNQFTQYESKYSKPSVLMTNNFNTCECLQETKKRKKLKSFGIGTKKIKMVSKSSETRTLGGTSNHLFSKSNFRTREISLQKFRNMRKCSGLCNWSAHTNERNPNWRQSIKINSNFSVNINIYEDTAHDSDIHYHDQESKNIVHRLSDNFKSLLKIKSPKTSGCICALELKKDEQRRGSKVLSPFSFTKKPNQVYTVSTVAMAETKIIAPKMPKMLTLKDVEDCRSVDSDDHTDNNKQALKQKNQWDYCDIKSTAVISTSKFAITAKNMQSCIFENAYETRKENSLKLSSRETVTIKSKFNCELNYVKTECFKDKRIHRNALYTNSTCELNEFAIENLKADTDVKKDVLIQTDHINRNHLTGVQPLLRRCYCTMNIQVAGQQSTKRRYRHSSKLKDYECEPGVCVPYECDPYECQKRIMRRLMKKVSTMSGTEKRLKTSASLTSSMKSVSRTRGLQSSYAHEQRHSQPKSSPMGLKYQTLPRTLRTHREAVRIGSNFSFDMEFSKRSTSPAKAKAPRLSTASRSSITSDRHHRDRGTKGFGEERQHRESQSTRRQMRHRGSSVKPMLRRCFCTLKLQKKGRQQKQIELQNQGTSTPPKFQVEKPILRTTETGQNTRAKQRYPELLPYECEPGICVPGECDPYNCLELIKRRKGNYTKDFGTESIASRTTSSSSMTPSQNRRRKQVQSRNVRVRPPKPRVTEVTSKPSITSSGRQLTPSRQAVRIGSSFSFNIEFYKDNTSPGDNVKRSPESYAHKTPRHVRTVPKYVHTRRATREDYSQRIKPTRDFDSQIGTRTHGQSTMTSGFLKRCFCTAKLQGNNHDTQTSHQKSSALKRCLCKFSSYIKDHSPPDNVGHESVPPVVEKHVIMTQTRRLSPTLLPYECEPGVCVPGFCDPYQCEKLIRRRLQGRMAGTEGPKTRSVSSSCTPCKTAKAGMTQFRSPRPPEHIRRRDHSPREMVIEDRVRSPALSRRQAVKYGSSFNFDIEFYKGKSPNYHQVQAATTVQRYRPSRKRDHGVYYGHRTRDMGTRGRGISVQNRDSQMFAARKRDTAIGTILRRCFCTLQLKRQLENDIQNQSKKDQQKQPKNKKQKQSIKDTQKQVKKDKQKQSKKVKQKQSKNDTKNQVKKGKSRVVKPATSQSRTVMTLNRLKRFHYNLEPYECEPGVCVPGECDPYECEKRIKNRGMHSSETLTEHYPTKSTSNMTRNHRQHRYSETPFVRRKPLRMNGVNYRERPKYSRVVESPSKQVVKIGSSFNFDIEFFKNKSPAGGLVTSRPEKRGRRRTTSRSTEWRSLPSRNKWAQGSRTMHDMNSQAFSRKMRSTMTGAGPFLKRCFCTLQLQKSENNTNHSDSASVSSVTEKEKPQLKQNPNCKCAEKSTNTIKQRVVVAEPAISQSRTVTTPDRLKRLHYKLEPYECEPGVCVPGECDPYECEKRIKKRMWAKQSGTEPSKTRSVSRSIGTRAKYRPRHTQARSYTPPQKAPSTHRRDEVQVIHNSSPNRQAVRISSSFSFSVEFYKDKSPQFPSVSEANIIYTRKKQGTETRSTRTRSRSSYNERSVLRNCQSQTDCIKSHCKGSCAPLRRCFCTLKLQKMGKEQQSMSYAEPFTLLMGTHTQTKNQIEIIPVAREIGTKTKKYKHTLEPYECEPGVCVPGLCDPYECAKRIKLRNLKHFGTGPIPTRSISSLTSRTVRNNALSTQLTPSTEKVHKIKRPYHTEVANNRPALSLGSNISINIEFFKDKSVTLGQYDRQERRKIYNNDPVTYQSKTSTYGTKSRTRGTYDKNYVDNRTSQAGADTESRGSGMGPFLKRCFCTLTLQRAEVTSKPNSPTTLSLKKTSTKKTNNPPQAPTQDLEPNECEPGVCEPGKCNPYECLERIKKRGIRRISRITGTRTRRSSQVSVSSMAAQCIPGYTCKKTQHKEEIGLPKINDRIIEEPRFPFLHNNRMKKGVRISSQFDINIEFYREPLPPTITEDKKFPNKTILAAKDRCIECNKRSTVTSSRRSTRNNLHNGQAKSQVVQTQDKSSAVGILKRCFCTAKLHKQSLTVGRVEQLRPIPLFGPREYWVQYEIPHINKETFKGYPLETIMSPRKFHNNKTCCRHKNKFCRFHSRLEGKLKSEAIRIDSKSKPSNFKKMLFCCRYLFRKRYNKNKVNDSDKVEIDQPGIAINRQPWIDILKPSKSERNPKTTAVPTIKKSKSLKVAKVGELNIHKKIFSRFQSGDADQENNNRIQNTTAKNIKNNFPRYQGHVQRVNNPLNKKVRFASLRNRETLKPLLPVAVEQPNDLKPISFLFKSHTFNKFEDAKLCSCCGGLRKRRCLPASRGELLNNKSFKNETGIRKSYLPKKMTPVSTKIVTFEEKMWLSKGTRKKLNQSCPCCVCKKKETNNFNNRPRNNIGKKGHDLCVCRCIACKKEAEKSAESKHIASRRNKSKKCDGTKSNKEAYATDFGHVCARKQKKKQRIQEKAEIREKLYKAENIEINKKCISKKIAEHMKSPDALPFAESVLFIGKLGITHVVFGPKRTYQNIQAFLRNPMRAWKKIQDAANTRSRVASLLRLQLRYHRMKCAKGDKEKLQECPLKNFVTHARETYPRKRVYPRKQHPAWRQQPDLAFRCSSFMLSLEKRPWLSGYYRCAWFYTHYLSVLQVWRRSMDILLFFLAVAVWSPCMLCAQLTKALMCCFLSKR